MVYGSNDMNERELWIEFNDIGFYIRDLWCICGDLNVVV